MSTAVGKWNALMNRHFNGCVHVGSMPDPHRDRTINAYILPGSDDDLGFTDGVDAWVAPKHNYLKRLQQSKNAPLPIERRRIMVGTIAHTSSSSPTLPEIVRRRIVSHA